MIDLTQHTSNRPMSIDPAIILVMSENEHGTRIRTRCETFVVNESVERVRELIEQGEQ